MSIVLMVGLVLVGLNGWTQQNPSKDSSSGPDYGGAFKSFKKKNDAFFSKPHTSEEIQAYKKKSLKDWKQTIESRQTSMQAVFTKEYQARYGTADAPKAAAAGAPTNPNPNPTGYSETQNSERRKSQTPRSGKVKSDTARQLDFGSGDKTPEKPSEKPPEKP